MPVVDGTLRADVARAWFVDDCGEYSVYLEGDGGAGFAMRPASARLLAEDLIACADRSKGTNVPHSDVRKAIFLTVSQGEFFEDNYEAMIAIIDAARRDGANTITIRTQSKEILTVDHSTKHTFGDQ